MAIPSEFITAICSHCERDIPTSNIDLHYAHCSSNLQKCAICADVIPKKHAEEHYNDNHAPVDCSLCSERVEREVLPLHKSEKCPQRVVTCEYCEFPLPAVDLFKHQEICGNRTEYCDICHRYVRLRERIEHDLQIHTNAPGTAEPPRRINGRFGNMFYAQHLLQELSSDIRSPERDQRANRRQARGSSRRQILWTIAVTVAAVIVGSFFYR